MISFVVHLVAAPGKHEALEALLGKVRDLTLQHEPGVAWYDFARSVDRADTYVVIEVYRDAEAHAAHMTTDWVRGSFAEIRALVTGEIEIRQYVSPGTAPVEQRSAERGARGEETGAG